MQYLNDERGNVLGVFLSLEEWSDIQARLDGDREAWMRKAVQRGLDDLEAGRFVARDRINAKFASFGINVES